MRTSVGLRRFASSHPSLLFFIFSGILENRMRGERGRGLNRAALPCRPLGGRPAPRPPPGTCSKKKNYKKAPVARCLGDRGPHGACRPHGRQGSIFEISWNRHIFLKFCIFLNIKKKKRRPDQSRGQFMGLLARTKGPQQAQNNSMNVGPFSEQSRARNQ